ncbi:hypothetical protein SAMN04489867_0299 [Pedococcus dokdonensis]|uniref:Uncharacterized protein n=1 Tax=Pedococcus dokdonensis TaxID=443156 RepID=A0A1H0LI91_9MICO|nr:hypothetical protein [Pedococcus dokdonensis]SDO67660.1 hypothetical protein SAMN04489867_0299 [Pedococcus dokdonensis]
MPNVAGNVAGLVLVIGTLVSGVRWLTTGRPPRILRPAIRRLQARRDLRRPVPEPIPPILLAMELSRLAAHIRRVEAGDQPRKAERLMAARLAYDHALRDYCRAVDIPVPTAIFGLSREQRFHMESALIGAGHDW